MLKEYLAKAGMLLANAILGRPVLAGACWIETRIRKLRCGSCGMEKAKRQYQERQCCPGVCFAWVTFDEWCDYC